MATQRRRLSARSLARAPALALCALAGCTSLSLAPPPSPAPVPTDPRSGDAPAPRSRSDTSAASQSLLAQSRAERAAGNYPQASASLERALRIDPNNPVLWLELGELHLQAGNSAQAEMMARKALSLAASDRSLEARADRLLRAAAGR